MSITVGIAGITGKFGRLVMKSFQSYPDVNIRGFCRDSSKLPENILSLPHVTVIQGESSDQAALSYFAEGCDVIICCYLGDNALMIEGQKLLVDACEFEKHPAKDLMKHVKTYLDTKTNIKGLHVLIGAFMETFWSGYFQVWNSKDFKFSYYGEGNEIWESTTYRTAGEYVAAVALGQRAVGIQYCVRKKPQLERLGSLDDLYNTMQEVYMKNSSNVYAYLAMFYQYYCINGQTYLRKELNNSKYPNIKPVTFEEFMQSHKVEELANTYQNAGPDI